MKMNFSKHDVIKTLNDAEELFVNYRVNPNFRIFEQFSEEELNKDYILPYAFDKRVGPTVAAAVAQAARDSGVARL